MKWIKKFNEELQPDVYRRAASKFRHYGKEDKTIKLSDWADLQEFGFYNIHFANNSSLIGKNIPFTKPELIGIYFTKSLSNIESVNLKYAKEDYIEEQANKLVMDWYNNGADLSIYFEFGFKPTQEALKVTNNHSYLKEHNKGKRYLSVVPVFTIELGLSDWSEGVEEYDSEAKWEADYDKREFTPTTIDQLYEWTAHIDYNLLRPYDEHYFAIFADRKSAVKFKNFFVDTMNSDIVKDKIVEIFRSLNCSATDLQRVLNSYNDVKIHGLYDDKPPGNRYAEKWFNKRINY